MKKFQEEQAALVCKELKKNAQCGKARLKQQKNLFLSDLSEIKQEAKVETQN